MSTELTLESLGKDINEIKTLVAGIKVGEHETEEDKEAAKKAAKKAEDEKKEEEKMQAKKAKYNSAIKKAMEEDDHDKKEAMVKKAMDELHDKKEGNEEPDPTTEKKATDEEKEKDAQIASIINDKKTSLIKQILTANRLINPNGLKEIETRLKSASITDVQKEFDIVKPFIAGVEPTTVPTPQQPIIPFYANITPADVDASTLTAASPDSDFSKLSTKELLEGA